MTAASTDDADLGDLLVRAAGGDRAAFAALYAATAPRAFGLALRVVRDPAQAEDLTLDAYLEVWRTAAAFDPARGGGLSWIVMTVHRVAVDHVRSVGRESMERRPVHLVTASPAPARVLDATACLSPHERQALELSYFDAHTHTDVAGLLGLPRGGAASRIRNGLLRLRGSAGGSDGLPLTP
jgi:RNA polymerase sigma-70 factor, ECF subfamily